MLYPIVLNRLGCRTKLATFLSDNETGKICRNLMKKMEFDDYENFNIDDENPVISAPIGHMEALRRLHNEGKNIES